MRKEEAAESVGVTCIVDGCDNTGLKTGQKELRVDFFFCNPPPPFIFCRESAVFGCRLRASGSM